MHPAGRVRSDLLSWGKISLELFLLAGPPAERHMQRLVRGDIRVSEVWPLPPLGSMTWAVVIYRKITENLSPPGWYFQIVFQFGSISFSLT